MNENAMDFFDETDDELAEANEILGRVASKKDGRICICGHSNGRHDFEHGVLTCQAAKQICPCLEKRLVLQVSNSRAFIRKTQGPGPLHALTLGVKSALAAGHEVKWLVEAKCDKCGSEGKVIPAAIDERSKRISYEPSGLNKFLCRDCREELE
jgi:hypothetical protein